MCYGSEHAFKVHSHEKHRKYVVFFALDWATVLTYQNQNFGITNLMS